MNPPHSMPPHNIEPWTYKVYTEFMHDPATRWDDPRDSFVGLVPAKTGPLWFHSLIPHCSARCFLKRRITFWQNGQPTEGPGKFDSLVFYIGPSSGLFMSLFMDRGWVV